MLRPQREPEAAEDFDCWVAPANGGDEHTAHKLSPLTPMPNVEQYRPAQPWVPADTWVELTFIDESRRRTASDPPQPKPVATGKIEGNAYPTSRSSASIRSQCALAPSCQGFFR